MGQPLNTGQPNTYTRLYNNMHGKGVIWELLTIYPSRNIQKYITSYKKKV
jgi:hypothetical protein